ncbi:MAG: hypothetical protein WKF56_05255 [Candidatus Limnocylindrales bacterium]
MSARETSAVRDARPPAAVLRIVNPVLRALLPSRLGRLIPALALIEFTGRHSGRPLSIVVSWHQFEGDRVVLTPAPWRLNFTGGATAKVSWRGQVSAQVGTLERDPAVVARAIDAMILGGTSPRILGLSVPAGHTVRADEVLGREMVRFRPES